MYLRTHTRPLMLQSLPFGELFLSGNFQCERSGSTIDPAAYRRAEPLGSWAYVVKANQIDVRASTVFGHFSEDRSRPEIRIRERARE